MVDTSNGLTDNVWIVGCRSSWIFIHSYYWDVNGRDVYFGYGMAIPCIRTFQPWSICLIPKGVLIV